MAGRFRVLARALALVLLLGVGLSVAPSAHAADTVVGTATLSGHLKNPDGSGYTGGGSISVYRLYNNTWQDVGGYEVTVDDTGGWVVSNLQLLSSPEAFRIGLGSTGGYDAQFYSTGSTAWTLASASEVPVAPEDSITGLDLTLAKNPSFGTISGHVTDPQGQPVPTAVKLHPDAGGTATVVLSDAGGAWSARVAAGSYAVSFSDSFSDGWATAWYGGTTATHVTVTGGGTTSGIDAQLASDASAATIGGHLTDPQGASVEAGVMVTVYDVTNSDRSFNTTTADGGVWEARVQGGDSYKLAFSEPGDDHYVAEYWNDATSLAGAQAITPAAGSTTTSYDAQLAFVPLVNTAAPTVSGTAVVGQTLTASPGTWTPSGASFAYQWLAGTTPISGATGSTYVLTSAEVTNKISVRVTASETGYASATASSAQTAPVKAKANVQASLRTPTTSTTTLVVKVASGVPTQGKVSIHDGSRLLGRVRVVDGRARMKVNLHAGVNHVRANYLGSTTVATGVSRLTVTR